MNDNVDITSGTIFDEKDYDEMQRTENHEIGYRLFSIMLFVVMMFAAVLIVVCGNVGTIVGMIISMVLLAVSFGFYIMYAAMTAKKGIMNPKFAKSWASKWVIIIYIALLCLWTFRLFRLLGAEHELSDIASPVVWIILCGESILMSLCARKNNRVVREQLEDEDKE